MSAISSGVSARLYAAASSDSRWRRSSSSCVVDSEDSSSADVPSPSIESMTWRAESELGPSRLSLSASSKSLDVEVMADCHATYSSP